MITLQQYTDAANALADKELSPASILRGLCVSLLDSVTATNSTVGSMPDDGDLSITFYDYGGGDMQDARNAIDMTHVQVRTRGAYESSYNIISEIKLALHAIPKLTLNHGDILTGVWLTSSIAHLGKDTQNRNIHTVNLRVAITPTNKGNRI